MVIFTTENLDFSQAKTRLKDNIYPLAKFNFSFRTSCEEKQKITLY